MEDGLDPSTPKLPRTPQAEDKTLLCPRCKVPAHQIWSRVYVSSEGSKTVALYDEARKDQRQSQGINGTIRVGKTWRSAHCQACDQKTLWRDDVNVYPVSSSAPAPHELLPPEVLELYEEAGRVLPLSRRAGAALIRAALERQLRSIDPDAPSKSRLDDRIARISPRVSTPLADMLDVIRHVGNASLHGVGDDDLVYLYLEDSGGADDIAELLFDAINDLVDELIARPIATKRIWDKLPEGVRASIAQKREAASS